MPANFLKNNISKISDLHEFEDRWIYKNWERLENTEFLNFLIFSSIFSTQSAIRADLFNLQIHSLIVGLSCRNLQLSFLLSINPYCCYMSSHTLYYNVCHAGCSTFQKPCRVRRQTCLRFEWINFWEKTFQINQQMTEKLKAMVFQ